MKKAAAALAVLTALGMALVIGLVVLYLCRPYASTVTTEGIAQGLAGGASAQIGEACYELSPDSELASAFGLESWERQRREPEGEPDARLRLAELWVIELYNDGHAAVYDGYASFKTKDEAFYRVPEQNIQDILQSVQQQGQQAAKPFNRSHFLH